SQIPLVIENPGKREHDDWQGNLLEAQSQSTADPREKTIPKAAAIGCTHGKVDGRRKRQNGEYFGVGRISQHIPIHDKNYREQSCDPANLMREQPTSEQVKEDDRSYQRRVTEPMN